MRKQISAGLAVVCLAAAGCLALLLTPVFNVRSVTVTGNKTIAAQDITKASGVVEGTNIFRVSLSAVRDNISSMNGISSVKVKRSLPSSIRITVREGTPMVYVECKGDYVGIAADLTVVEVVKGSSLPAISAPAQEDKPSDSSDKEEDKAPEEDKDSGEDDEKEEPAEAAEAEDSGEPEEEAAQFKAPVVTGMSGAKYKVGRKIEFSDEKKGGDLQRLMEEFLADEACRDFTSIDMSVYDNVSLVYKGQLKVRLGSAEELSHKLKCFKAIMKEQLDSDASGTLDLERLTYSPKKN